MISNKLTFPALLFALAMSCQLFSDTIILKQGQTLTGDILAEKDDHIYLDIGISVLTIEKTDILEINYDTDTTVSDTNDANALIAADSLQTRALGRLYYTADLPIKTIEQCVNEVSEAVVKVSTPGGLGSGFFINEEGYLITNYHVIERETRISVTVFQKVNGGFEKKKFKKVRIEAINPFVDLALLKVEDFGETKIAYACLGDMEEVKVGEPVFAIGNPLGLERTVTDGLVSIKSRAFQGLVYLQTNADINPGNSGGPLFNLSGEVIGVTNMGYIFFGGLGFAIPIDYVKHFVDNREAFAYDKDNPNSGFRYIQPDRRLNPAAPKLSTEKKKRK